MSDLLTVSDLQEITGLPATSIRYALARYGPKHAGRIGITRVWHRASLPRIQESLARTQRNRKDRRRETAPA